MKTIKLLTGLSSIAAIGTTAAMCGCSHRDNTIKYDVELSEFELLLSKPVLYKNDIDLEANKSYTFKIDTSKIVGEIALGNNPPVFIISKNETYATLYQDSVSVQYIHNNKITTLIKDTDYKVTPGSGRIDLLKTETTQQLCTSDIFYITLKVVKSVEKYMPQMTFTYEQ